MPVTLSIKNVPEDVIRIIKAKAARAETSSLLTTKGIVALAETVDFLLPNETTRMLGEDCDR